MEIHITAFGETVKTIAEDYKVPEFSLRENNNLENGTEPAVGQALLVLMPEIVHRVSGGETLFSIARDYGVSLNTLFRNNPSLGGLGEIYPEREIVIEYERNPIGQIDVNGYAYPFVDKGLLRETLPYITFLTPFTYGIAENGDLVTLDDDELISLAYTYGALPWMHLSTLTEGGTFSNELASLVLTNSELQSRLSENIVRNIIEKGYRGLDIDFEFVYADEAALYADFIGRMRSTLEPFRCETVAALAPKTSDNQTGLLYEGHDYGMIGDAADAVLLMTYEWGYAFSEPMAVAPINGVRRVLEYALSKIPRGKIFLGIPNYGYDWKLPYVKGETRARSISNVEAVRLAAARNAQIEYDEAVQSPWFNYRDENGAEHEVWFEDVRSIEKKLELISENSLRGAGYWNLMRPFRQNWALLNYMFDVNNEGA